MTLLRPLATGALAVATLTLTTFAVAQTTAEDPLRWVPADAEFVAYVDWRALVDSPIVRELIDKKTTPQQLEAQMSLVKNLTGTNLLTDLDRGLLWGRIGDDDSVVVVVEGRFEPEKLITIIKANSSYSTTTLDGLTIHQWHDKNEDKDKVGAFLNPNTLAISSNAQQISAARAAAAAGDGFKNTALAAMAPSRNTVTGFALLARPERALPAGVMDDTMQARAALLTMTMKPDDLTMGMTIFAENDDAAAKWIRLAEGGRALLELQSKKPNAALLAQDIVITRGEKSSAVVSLTLPKALLLELADKPE